MKKINKTALAIVVVFLVSIFISIVCVFESRIPVLGYHSFTSGDSNDQFVLKIDQFEEQLKYLSDHNYKSLSMDELYDIYRGKKKKPMKSVVITFDDGYMSNYELAFPLMKKYHMKGTVFVIGCHAKYGVKNYMDVKTLKKVKKEYPNIEIASHSFDLHKDGVTNKSESTLEDDFTKMGGFIKTKYFAYPYGLNDKRTRRELHKNGYKMAFTFGPGKEHRRASAKDNQYMIPRLNISNNMPMWKFILRLKLD